MLKDILIVDGYNVIFAWQSLKKLANESLVYTDDGETADSFIEREVFLRQGKYTNVYVVTSDGAEQNQILGSGGLRIPARELQNDMRLAKQEERLQYTHKHHRDQMVLRRNEVYDHLAPDVAEKLEAIRRGTK